MFKIFFFPFIAPSLTEANLFVTPKPWTEIIKILGMTYFAKSGCSTSSKGKSKLSKFEFPARCMYTAFSASISSNFRTKIQFLPVVFVNACKERFENFK